MNKETNKIYVDEEELKEFATDHKAIEILREKLMYEVDPFDFREYDTYEDYEQQYYEHRFDDPDGEGYPDWYLKKEEFELLKEKFR